MIPLKILFTVHIKAFANLLIFIVFDQYARYAKFMAKRHLAEFERDKFYKVMSNSLLACDFVLKPPLHIRFETCDTFMQGAIVPEADQIILCSNVLIER